MPLLGHRFRELRIEQGLTQEDLAERLNVNIRQITRYENGESDPSADVLSRMARVFGVTADYLLGLTDDQTGNITEEDLSPIERQLILAARQGRVLEAIKAVASMSDDINKPGVGVD